MSMHGDELFDRRVATFLAERAEELASGADGEQAMVARLEPRLRPASGLAGWGAPLRGLVWLALLAALLLALLVALTLANRPRPVPHNGLLTWVNETDIRVDDLRRSEVRSLVQSPPLGPGDVCCALAWSPDGRRLALEQGSDLVVMDADGSNQHTLLLNSTLPSAPVWSPDGTKIAFSMLVKGWFQVAVINADGTGLQQVAHGVLFSINPSWSPDGRWLAFGAIPLPPGVTNIDQNSPDARWSLFVASVDGTTTRAVLDLAAVRAATGISWQISQWSGGPAWSPDGRQVAFDARTSGSCCRMRLYAVNVDGSGLRRLGDDSVNPSNPAWSPDSTNIAFSSWRTPDSNEIGPTDLYELRPDGTGLTRIADDAGPFVWSPDGSLIAYAHLHYGSWSAPPGAATALDSSGHQVQGQGWSQLWIAGADGSSPRLVDGNGVTNGLSWQPVLP